MRRPSPQQIQLLKRKLLEQRKSLLRSAQHDLAHWGEHTMAEVAGEAADLGDESFATLVTNLDHAMLERHLAAIRDVDSALSRIREGRYAICTDCADDIEFHRLSVFPTAKRCIECQRRHEGTFAEEAGLML